jgi:predicted nucleotidyltransferase
VIENKTHLPVPGGTQIVTLIRTKILNKDEFQQRGTVGVIRSAPADASHSYLIEFTDGTMGSMRRTEFSIRKEFQTEKAVPAMEGLDLSRYVIYRCVVGSKAFGLDDENSDTDYRGIYLPPADVQWSLYGIPEQLEDKDREECFWELQKFLVLALKANPNILECLFTPLVEYANEIAKELLSLREIFLSKLVYQTYNGYVMSQFKKLEQDLRARGEIKWKHAMHLIRLLLQGIDILRDGDLKVSVDKNRSTLLNIKKGESDWESVNAWRLDLHKEFADSFEKTRLPERPDYERANDFLIRARRAML